MNAITKTEKQVATLAREGLTVKEIARVLHRSPETVKKHIDHAREKLQAKNTVHMVAIAISRGIITPLCILLCVIQISLMIPASNNQNFNNNRYPVRTSVRMVRTTRVGRKIIARQRAAA